jgi:flagellar biosynthesis protein FlhG
MSEEVGFRTEPGQTGAMVFVVGSGKGGVGKSVLSIMLASALRQEGRRVLLFDGCQDRGHLHILLGVRQAAKLGALHSGDATPDDLLVSIGDDLWLLPVDSGADAVRALTPTDRARLHLRLTSLFDHFDVVIVDAGSGFESTLRATMGATRLLAVAVPEPASLCDAYALIKLVTLETPLLPIDVVVNRTEGQEQAMAAFERLSLAARRFLKRDVSYLGAVVEHPDLRRAVCHPGELLAIAPADVLSIAKRMSARCGAPNGDHACG